MLIIHFPKGEVKIKGQAGKIKELIIRTTDKKVLIRQE